MFSASQRLAFGTRRERIRYHNVISERSPQVINSGLFPGYDGYKQQYFVMFLGVRLRHGRGRSLFLQNMPGTVGTAVSAWYIR